MSARDFRFGTAWNLAARGTAIWYAGQVDVDRNPLSILNLPTQECALEWDELHVDRIVTWRGRKLDTARTRILRLEPVPGELWGQGPLQRVGAAVSAAAEADDWAARYFLESGVTATHLHSAAKLTDAEADAIRDRWVDSVSSVRVTSGGVLSSAALGASPKDSQLIDARLHGRGDAAVMWGIPGKLLEYAQSGTSLTYQNVGDLMTELVRETLAPLYLTPIEDALTDFMVRRRTCRFDVGELQRADPKTRWDIHAIASTIGAYTGDDAAVMEGIKPGSPSTAPVPAAGPRPSLPAGGGSGARNIA